MKAKKDPWTALFPCPVVLVTCVDSDSKHNVITLAWAGTVCSEPPMIGLGIRPHRHSYSLIESSREFVVNIPTEAILRETDYCGQVSGRSVDKFLEAGLTPVPAERVKAPLIRECPVNIECVVKNIIPLGVHHLFLGEIMLVHVDQDILDEKGEVDFKKAAPFVYNHGQYWSLGRRIGAVGLSKPQEGSIS